jgi:C4-dicarboxylate transporter
MASDELTILTPAAPCKTLPATVTDPVLVSVTVELLAAAAVFSSPAAVTRSIWLSRSACALLCFLTGAELDLL